MDEQPPSKRVDRIIIEINDDDEEEEEEDDEWWMCVGEMEEAEATEEKMTPIPLILNPGGTNRDVAWRPSSSQQPLPSLWGRDESFYSLLNRMTRLVEHGSVRYDTYDAHCLNRLVTKYAQLKEKPSGGINI